MAKDLSKILKEKVERLESVPQNFLDSVEKQELSIYKELLKSFDKLERNNDGFILLNNKNIDLMAEINGNIVKIVRTSDYESLVNDFIKEFDTQIDLNNVYFEGITESSLVVPKESVKLVELYKQSAFNDLYSKNALMSSFAKPINEILRKTVTSEGSFVEMAEDIRNIVVGDKNKLGKLRSYAGQIAWDTWITSERAYTKQVSDANNIEWFRYAGGLVEDSRQFCVHRSNKYYHKKEIEMWGNNKEWSQIKQKFVTIKDWPEKIEGTNEQNIFTNVAGWNCRHSLVPVSILSVPKDVVKDAIDKGFVKLSKKQKESLKIE